MKNRATAVLGTVTGLVGLAVYVGRVLKQKAPEAPVIHMTDETARRILHSVVYGVPGVVEPWDNPPRHVLAALAALESRGPLHVGEPSSGKWGGLLSPWASDDKTGLPMEDGEHVEPIVERWVDSRPSGIGNFMSRFTEPTQADDVAVETLYRLYQEDGGQVTKEGFLRILGRLGYRLRKAGGVLFVDGVGLQPQVAFIYGDAYPEPDTLREQRDPDA